MGGHLTTFHISIRRIRAFTEVARVQSLSSAAHALRLSQPALSQSISHLEQQLDIKLFDRQSEGSFLTSAGLIFQRRTERFFAQIAEAVSHSRADKIESADVAAVINKLSYAHIRSILAIWRCGHFRAAALHLSISQASLQRAARQLELIMGVPLYRRSASGLGVNERGEFFARRCALALAEIEAGRQEINAAQHQNARIRIGILPLAPRMILAQAMHMSHELNGMVEIIDGSYEQLAVLLNDGALDVLVGALRSPSSFDDLTQEPLFEDPYVIVSRPDHPLFHQSALAMSDIADYQWILPPQGLPRRFVLDDWFKLHALTPQGIFETSCLLTIAALLSKSDDLSILSRSYVELDGASHLRALDQISIPHKPRLVGLTYRRNWLPTPFQADVMAHLRASASVFDRHKAA